MASNTELVTSVASSIIKNTLLFFNPISFAVASFSLSGLEGTRVMEERSDASPDSDASRTILPIESTNFPGNPGTCIYLSLIEPHNLLRASRTLVVVTRTRVSWGAQSQFTRPHIAIVDVFAEDLGPEIAK